MVESNPIQSDVYPSLTYDDAPGAIEWLCEVFGFKKRLVVAGEGNLVVHSELSFGNAVVMVSSPKPDVNRVSPRHLRGVAQTLSLFTADPGAHHDAAVAAGAVVMRPLQTESFGARGYMVRDPEGHVWYFSDYRPGAFWEDGS